MKTRISFCIVLLCAALLAACSFTQKASSSEPRWDFDGKGWVLHKGASGGGYEKFFAIGTWHVPGYAFTDSSGIDSPDYEKDALLFKQKTAPFNMVFMAPGHQKDYMSDKIHILNPFSPMLHQYIDQHSNVSSDKIDKDYYNMQYIRKQVNSSDFEKYLDLEIKALLENLPNDKYIYSHIDEIALGGVSKWCVPNDVGAKIYERVKKQDADALVFVDLLGHSRGSTYFFEQRYLQSHDSLPKDLPYELVNPEARNCKIPLLGFFEAHNGQPVYDFKDGKYSYSDYDFETLKSLWYENTKLIATGYKKCGNVFGINAFRDFFAYPILSAVTVDALKEGLGEEIPIWIYFDGNGYAKPADMPADAYVETVKCQIYTSIIHGATGILFWNDWSKTPEVFDVLHPMLMELSDNLPIIKLETVDLKIDNDLHILIKKDANGKKYIVATNTSKTNEQELNIPDVTKKSLAPLETYIATL